MATRAIPDADSLLAPAPVPALRRQTAPTPAALAPVVATPAVAAPVNTAPVGTDGGFLAASQRPRPLAIATVLVLHLVVIGALLAQRFTAAPKPPPETMVVMNIAAPPPVAQAAKAPPLPETPAVTVPPPVIEIDHRPPAITAILAIEPPTVAPVAATSVAPVTRGPAAPAAARPPAEVAAGDLSATMIEMVPPRYPYESRRRKEQGTVVLDVVLATDGSVDKVAVRTSSGFARLDTAAAEAVRRWRWSPTLRDGVAVMVRGVVEIPFLLSPARGR